MPVLYDCVVTNLATSDALVIKTWVVMESGAEKAVAGGPSRLAGRFVLVGLAASVLTRRRRAQLYTEITMYAWRWLSTPAPVPSSPDGYGSAVIA